MPERAGQRRSGLRWKAECVADCFHVLWIDLRRGWAPRTATLRSFVTNLIEAVR